MELAVSDRSAHVFAMHLNMLRFLGAKVESVAQIRPRFWLSEADESFAEWMLAPIAPGRLKVVCCPGSAQPCKVWNPEGYAQVFGRLPPATVLLVGTAQNGASVPSIGSHCDVVDLRGRTTLNQLAALIQRCDLFLGVDSAPVHMAIAAGRPSVAVTGGVGFGRFLPWGRRDINRLAGPAPEQMLESSKARELSHRMLQGVPPDLVARECEVALVNGKRKVVVSQKDLGASAERTNRILDALAVACPAWEQDNVWT